MLGGLLGAFKSLSFYPDCTQALLLAGRLRPSALGPAENALMGEVEAAVRAAAGCVCSRACVVKGEGLACRRGCWGGG